MLSRTYKLKPVSSEFEQYKVFADDEQVAEFRLVHYHDVDTWYYESRLSHDVEYLHRAHIDINRDFSNGRFVTESRRRDILNALLKNIDRELDRRMYSILEDNVRVKIDGVEQLTHIASGSLIKFPIGSLVTTTETTGPYYTLKHVRTNVCCVDGQFNNVTSVTYDLEYAYDEDGSAYIPKGQTRTIEGEASIRLVTREEVLDKLATSAANFTQILNNLESGV